MVKKVIVEDISLKNTKQQILDAYHAALERLENKQLDEPSAVKQNEKKTP